MVKYLLEIGFLCACLFTSVTTAGAMLIQGEEKSSHSHEWNKYSQTQADCERDGEIIFVCGCGEINTITVETAFGHDVKEMPARSAACEGIGWTAYAYCTNCDYTSYREIPALGHDYVTSNIIEEVTCEQAGLWAYVCQTCGNRKEEKVEPIGHNLQTFEGKEVTCSSVGWQEYQECTKCGYTTKEEIPMLAHTWDTGKKTTLGTRFSCVNCDEFYIEGHTHVWNEPVISQNPTCTGMGIEIISCYCGYPIINEISSLGHDWGDKTITAETETIACNRCEAVQTEAHEHKYAETSSMEATCMQDGEIRLECLCGKRLKIVIPATHFYENGRCIYCRKSENSEENFGDSSDSSEEIVESSEEESSVEENFDSVEGSVVEESAVEDSSSEYIEEESSIEESAIEESSAEESKEEILESDGQENISSEESSEEASENDSIFEEVSSEENSEESSVDYESSFEETSSEDSASDETSSEENDSEIDDANAENLIYKEKDGTGLICVGIKDKNVWQIKIPDEYDGLPVVEIAAGAFVECWQLAKIEIGANVTKIRDGAVYNNPCLMEIYNRSGMKKSSFEDWGAKHIYTDENDSRLTAHANGCITYQEDGEIYLVSYAGTQKSVVIPEGVTVIRIAAFTGCTVERVTIASSVEKIERKAFYNVKGLTRVLFLQPEEWKVSDRSGLSMCFDFTEYTEEEIAENLLCDVTYLWERI